MAKITDIEAQKKRKDRVSVYLDGEFWTGMPNHTAALLGLKIGIEVSSDKKIEIEEEIAHSVAFDKAANLLSYRDRSEQELRRRLKEYGFNEGITEATIQQLRDYDYVNDEAFSAQLIEAQKQKGKARRAASYAMSQAGVDREVIEVALDEHYPSEEELEVALEWAKGKFVDTPQGHAKLQRQLASRGFSFDICRSALRKLSETEVEEY